MGRRQERVTKKRRGQSSTFLQEWLPCRMVSDIITSKVVTVWRCADGDDDEGVNERKRKKKVQSSIVQELRNEYLDLPEEVNVGHVTIT